MSASHLRADLLLQKDAPAPIADLQIAAREIAASGAAKAAREARVRCTGYDRPGIVYRVTEVLADAGFNIDELTTDTISVAQPQGKPKPFFLLEGVVTAKRDIPIEVFETRLEGLRKTLDAKITVTWS